MITEGVVGQADRVWSQARICTRCSVFKEQRSCLPLLGFFLLCLAPEDTIRGTFKRQPAYPAFFPRRARPLATPSTAQDRSIRVPACQIRVSWAIAERLASTEGHYSQSPAPSSHPPQQRRDDPSVRFRCGALSEAKRPRGGIVPLPVPPVKARVDNRCAEHPSGRTYASAWHRPCEHVLSVGRAPQSKRVAVRSSRPRGSLRSRSS